MNYVIQVVGQSAMQCWTGAQVLYADYIQPAMLQVGEWITENIPWAKDVWDILYSTAAQIMKVRYQVKIVILAITLPYLVLSLGRRRRRRRRW